MRTNYVLIDYENKPQVDIDAIEKALPGAHVLVFVGTQQKSLPTTLVQKIQTLGHRAKFVFNTVSGVKNALDMLMAMSVGELIAEKNDPSFHIVSADQDFKPLITNLNSRGIPAKFLQIEPKVEKSTNKTPKQIAAAFRKTLGVKNGPHTISKLMNELKTLWGKHAPTDAELGNAIDALVKANCIKVDGEKVTYPDKPSK